MRRTAVLTAFAALSLLAAPVWAQDSANLGPTFKQGAKSRYELSNKAKQIIQAPQGEMTIDVDTTLVIACEVTSADSTGATVRATIEGLKTNLQSPMFADGFDSAKPAEQDASSQLAPFVRPVVGKSFTVKFDPTGANADVDGIDGLLPNDPQIAQIVAQAIGANGLGTAVVGFYVLKDGMEPVKVGDTWSDTQDSPAQGLGTITITTNSKFSEMANEVATVTVDGNAKFVADPAAAQQGVTMSIDQSTIDGVIRWNTGVDMLKELTSNSTIVMSINMQAMPGATQTMRIVNESSAKRLD